MKGVLILYANTVEGQDENFVMQMILSTNESLIKILKEQGYELMIVPTKNESSRIEKIDFNMPISVDNLSDKVN